MRWNCPHCGVALAVSDEKIGSGWTFSRCYKCGGFAMVRKAEANLVKVDQAPLGEKVILPEGSETPTLSNQAIQNLAGILKSGEQPKPVVIPSQRRAGQPKPPTPPPFKRVGKKPHVIPSVPTPQALEEGQTPPWIQKGLPIAISLAALSAIGSGFYLYKKGQDLYVQNLQTPQIQLVPYAPPPPPKAIDQLTVSSQAAPERTPPTPSEDESNLPLPGLVVRPKSAKVMLRQGPGLEHAELGYANPSLQYVVTAWKDRWFKVLIHGSKQAAWVRNDLVDLTPVNPDND